MIFHNLYPGTEENEREGEKKKKKIDENKFNQTQ